MKERELASFLNSNKINQSTDDDKTLLLCAFQECIYQKESGKQQGNLENKHENNSRETNSTRISEILEPDTTEAAISSRRILTEQKINTLIVLIQNELNKQGYQNIIPKVKAETNLIKIYLLSSEPLVYQRLLGKAVYKAVHSLKEFRTREVAIANYVHAGGYKRIWVKRLPGFLGLFF